MSGNDIWTTVSSVTETVEDTNPAVWYEAAKNATTYESAIYYYEKAERYYKNDRSGYLKEWFLKEQLYYKFHKKKVHIVLSAICLTVIAIFCSLIHSEYKRREEIEEARRIRIEENRKAREAREAEIAYQKRLAQITEDENRNSLFNEILNNSKKDIYYETKYDYAELSGNKYIRRMGKGLITDAKIENGKRFIKLTDKDTYDSNWVLLNTSGLKINYDLKIKKLDIDTIQKTINTLNDCEQVLFNYDNLTQSILKNRISITGNEIDDIIKELNQNAIEAERLTQNFNQKEADNLVLSEIKEDILYGCQKMAYSCEELGKYYNGRVRYIKSKSNDYDFSYYEKFKSNYLNSYKHIRNRLNRRIAENNINIRVYNTSKPTEAKLANKGLNQETNQSTSPKLIRSNPDGTFLLFVKAINERRLADAKEMLAPGVKDSQFFEFLVSKSIKIQELKKDFITETTKAVYTFKAETKVESSIFNLRGKVELVKIGNLWYLKSSKF